MKAAALHKANAEAQSEFDREHVTSYVRESECFTQETLRYEQDLSNLRWTVDDPEDFEVVEKVFQYFSPKIHFSWKDVLKLQKDQPSIFEINQQTTRNEGVTMGTGQKLWGRAKQVIPGGNMLLSKRPEMFLPEQ